MYEFAVKIFFLDVKIVCSVARDIANCTKQHLTGCIAEQVDKYQSDEYFH